MYTMVDIRAKKLHTKYKDVSLFLRDGLVKDKVINKSINHLHFHILPNVGIHIQTPTHQKADARIFLDDDAYTKTAQTYKKTFLYSS
jgi:diadenosine tetraphosphate (Ap4A) HIT family hydrolase